MQALNTEKAGLQQEVQNLKERTVNLETQISEENNRHQEEQEKLKHSTLLSNWKA